MSIDPRHPEMNIPRVRELFQQYNRVLDDMERATTSSQLNELEREGAAVVQEIYFVVPRLHDAMIQVSRQRRHDLAHGVLDKPQNTFVEAPVEKYVAPNQAETVIVEPKPRKKSTKKAKK